MSVPQREKSVFSGQTIASFPASEDCKPKECGDAQQKRSLEMPNVGEQRVNCKLGSAGEGVFSGDVIHFVIVLGWKAFLQV